MTPPLPKLFRPGSGPAALWLGLALVLAGPGALALPRDQEAEIGYHSGVPRRSIRVCDLKRGADFRDVVFLGDLERADFRETLLAGASFPGANCNRARFDDLDLRATGIDLARSLTGAVLSRARLREEWLALPLFQDAVVSGDPDLADEDQPDAAPVAGDPVPAADHGRAGTARLDLLAAAAGLAASGGLGPGAGSKRPAPSEPEPRPAKRARTETKAALPAPMALDHQDPLPPPVVPPAELPAPAPGGPIGAVPPPAPAPQPAAGKPKSRPHTQHYPPRRHHRMFLLKGRHGPSPARTGTAQGGAGMATRVDEVKAPG